MLVFMTVLDPFSTHDISPELFWWILHFLQTKTIQKLTWRQLSITLSTQSSLRNWIPERCRFLLIIRITRLVNDQSNAAVIRMLGHDWYPCLHMHFHEFHWTKTHHSLTAAQICNCLAQAPYIFSSTYHSCLWPCAWKVTYQLGISWLHIPNHTTARWKESYK